MPRCARLYTRCVNCVSTTARELRWRCMAVSITLTLRRARGRPQVLASYCSDKMACDDHILLLRPHKYMALHQALAVVGQEALLPRVPSRAARHEAAMQDGFVFCCFAREHEWLLAPSSEPFALAAIGPHARRVTPKRGLIDDLDDAVLRTGNAQHRRGVVGNRTCHVLQS